MSKVTVKQQIQDKVMAIIRADERDFAVELCQTVLAAGVHTIEVTFTVPDAANVIAHIKEHAPNAVVGAGTVLSANQAAEASRAGADFIVAPCVVEEVASFCREVDIFCVLGAMTPTEAFQAYQAGSDAVKLFPGDQLDPKFIRAIKEPFPFMDFIPTGGIGPDNARTWFEHGAWSVGVGGYLTKGVQKTNLAVVGNRCRLLLESLHTP